MQKLLKKISQNAVLNKNVFFGSTFLIFSLVLLSAFFPKKIASLFSQIQNLIVADFGWFYMLSVAIFLIFCVGLACSSHGRIKLGPDHAEPDYSYFSWFSMLFSAGMGIGILFFAVAEPVMHYIAPPVGNAGTIQAAQQAMAITFFHWGLHAWAIYAMVGLILAYFSFRHNLPLTIRSAFYPLIGERIYGKIGDAVDISAVLGTMFGIATSLGLGVVQVNTGLNYLFGLPVNLLVQIVLIIGITLIATASVVSGLDSGVKRLSELNLFMAVALLVFIFLAGPTFSLLQLFVQNIGTYLSSVVNKTFNLYAYQHTGWIGGWTLFYWGWWIAWSPFVGMFIARISRGRTIREFILSVLLVPTGFTFMWMTFFGNTAIGIEHAHPGFFSSSISAHPETAIFKLFEQLPFTQIASFFATVLIVTFFVTSSDSGSLVIDTITSGGKKQSPVWQRVFWAFLAGIVAAVLLLVGGLQALQTASIISALPFAIVILMAGYGLLRALKMERLRQHAFDILPAYSGMYAEKGGWRKRVRAILNHPAKSQVHHFLHNNVKKALVSIEEELEAQGLDTEVTISKTKIALTVRHDEEPAFVYAVGIERYFMPDFMTQGKKTPAEKTDGVDERQQYYRAEVFLSEGGQHYDIMGYPIEEIIADVLTQYEKHMHFLYLVRE